MNITYFNFALEKISNDEIEKILHQFTDLLPMGIVSVTSGEGFIDYMGKVFDFFCSSDKEGVSSIDAFLKVLFKFSSVD
ncbi:hypothetical protein COY05_03635 [Candidatus Peregrinibacteria bacterium CG_4_10_14_0_2_um_filter_38_24]|nr:MAG: hypothetical protein COY05_03635 [Candidatus Peregrinibacteria bacterium CG_4_10_14_0_2_um_filter_38_24]PJC39386.1 MAG: hypothetical protein CO044_00015 [Candidatus Peregrinibacteria bacterium CG_4_9_14_0_2_um_filter_38_9]